MQYRYIDADSHVNEPPDLWQKRVPAKFRHLAPKVVPWHNGGDAWSYEDGKHIDPVGFTAVAGLERSQYRRDGFTYDPDPPPGLYAVPPGSYDPRKRIEAMEQDAIDAQVIYPSVALTGPHQYSADRELQLACVRAYNDWICEFNAYDPKRLIGLGIAPLTGIDDLLAEFRRVMKMGLKGIILSAYPNGSFTPDPQVDNRFWAEAQEIGLPVHIHFGFFPASQGGDPDKPLDMSIPVVMRMGVGVYKPLADLIHHGVFEAFPRLKVVAVETGIGWIPFFLQTIDDNYLRQRWHIKSHLKRMPSEYFRENIYATFVTDRLGLERRHDFGVEHILWSTDYPHIQSDWPNSMRTVFYEFMGIPEEDKRKIVCENARGLYQL